MGFPASLTECFVGGCQCHSRPPSVRVLYPQMKIICNGTLVRWRVAGAFLPQGAGPNVNIVLSIWRERSAESGIYNRVGAIALGFCGNRIAIRDNNVFECTLPQNSRVTVQTGDIVGVEVMANRGFQILYHHTASGTRSYRFNRRTSSTVHLSDSDITLTDVVATVATTTQISTTSISAMTINTTLFQTTLTPQTSTIFNSVDQSGSIISTAKIAGAAAGGVIMIVLCLAIIVFVIKRC